MDLGKGFSEIVVVLTAIIGLAIVAVLVSNRAQTANVLTAAGGAFSTVIKAAVSPVVGGPGAFQIPMGQSSGQEFGWT